MSDELARRPCIIGVAQRTVRKEERPAPEPLVLCEEVARAAASDAGARGDVLAAIESVRVIFCESWAYDDLAGRLAEGLGITPAECTNSTIGGRNPQVLLSTAGDAIIRGELDVALVCGAESLATVSALQAAGETPNWSFPAEREYPLPRDAVEEAVDHNSYGGPFKFSCPDNARRARLEMTRDDYRRELGELLAGMTTVAARNPHAWFPRAQSADSIITPRPDNRWVAYPYTKHMVAMWNCDMAAALIVASHDAADRLGVPDDRRVYLHGWCAADDLSRFGARPEISYAPATRAASQEALRCAGIELAEVQHLDIYTCFTSALNYTRDALGIGDRPGSELTVTGGLPYAGGPGSNYMSHALATMTQLLRAHPDSFGMCTATGMNLHKQSAGVYNTRPPATAPEIPALAEVQRALDDLPSFDTTAEYVGSATVATFSIHHDRSGEPVVGVAICDVDDGVRAYARIDDADVLSFAVEDDLVGQKVELVQGKNCVVVKADF